MWSVKLAPKLAKVSIVPGLLFAEYLGVPASKQSMVINEGDTRTCQPVAHRLSIAAQLVLTASAAGQHAAHEQGIDNRRPIFLVRPWETGSLSQRNSQHRRQLDRCMAPTL